MTNKRPEKTRVIFKINEKSYKKQIKQINEAQSLIKLNVEIWNKKKHELKKKKVNMDKSPKLELISQIHNLWNLKPRLNRKLNSQSIQRWMMK